MESKVYIVQCPDYTEIEEKLTSLVNLMGGMGKFARNGEKIVLKANLLREARPEQAVCTHPSVIAAVGSLAREEGAHPVIADSPGGGYRYTAKILDKIYRTSGMLGPPSRPVLKSTGIRPPGLCLMPMGCSPSILTSSHRFLKPMPYLICVK